LTLGTLYLVATPIGNLEDITLRAVRILGEVGAIAAEDTRTTRKLLAHHGIRQRPISYNEHNMKIRTPELLKMLETGDLALVSEAGMPSISDPGYELVVAAIDAGFTVVPVPGPSAVIAALAASGLPTRQFTFLGFLPRKAGERRRLLESLSKETRTIVAFESHHRLQRTLADMLAVLGDRRVAVCRELTKLFEETFRASISQAIEHFSEPRGEFTLVIEGQSTHVEAASDDVVRDRLVALKRYGTKAREAVRQVATETGKSHREVYHLWVEISAAGETDS